MNCERATETYLANLAGESDPTEESAMHAHLESCAACRDATQALGVLWEDLDRESEPPPVTLGPRVAALVEGYRQGRREAGARVPWREHATGWLGRVFPAAALRPASAAVALVAGLALGTLWDRFENRSEIAALRQEVQSTRGLVALSLLQQRSPADRLQGVAWTARMAAPDRDVREALIATLDGDPNVNVRLAVVDALAASLDEPRVRDVFLAALDRQTSPLVQIALIDALAQAGESRSRAAFQRLADNTQLDATVRARAQWALRQLGS